MDDAAAFGAAAFGAGAGAPPVYTFPFVKPSQELTLPCRDSSQFFWNSCSSFLLSAIADSSSALRAASVETFCSAF